MNLTFSTLKARFWHMFGLFLCTIPLVIVLIVGIFAGFGAMTQASTASTNPSDSLAALGGIGMAILIGYLLYFLADAWLRSSLLASALSHQAGTPSSFLESLGRGLKHTPMVFLISLAAFFVYMMCYLVGYIIIIVGAAGGAAADSGATAAIFAVLGIILMFAGAVPAFYLWCRWYVNTAARVAEGTGIFSSFHRSRDLTMDHKWTLAGHWLVILAIFMLIYFIVYAVILVIFASSFASLMQASANPNPDPQAILDVYSNMFAGVGIVGGIIGGILYLLILFLFVAIPACSYAACYTLLRRAKEGDTRVAEVFS
jgi:uncharacterized membrane protein YjgN (DUF898 family)